MALWVSMMTTVLCNASQAQAQAEVVAPRYDSSYPSPPADNKQTAILGLKASLYSRPHRITPVNIACNAAKQQQNGKHSDDMPI